MRTDNRKPVCLFRITARDREKLEALVFKRYPHREWGSFFRFGYRLTRWGIHVSFVDAIEPQPGELKRASGIVEFEAGYILRTQMALAETNLGIGVIHSHPQGCGTFASSLDNDMDGYFSREFATYGKGRPYVSLRVARDDDGEFSFSGEARFDGKQIPVSEWLTVGDELQREAAQQGFRSANTKMAADERTARFTELIGERTGRIRRSAVAVIGCGGLGSPAVQSV